MVVVNFFLHFRQFQRIFVKICYHLQFGGMFLMIQFSLLRKLRECFDLTAQCPMLCQWVRIWTCLPLLRQWVSVAYFQCFVFRELIYVSSVSLDGADTHIDRCARKVNHIDLTRSSVCPFFLPLNLITVSIFPCSIPWLANVFWAFRKVLGSGWEWLDTFLASEDPVVLGVCHPFLFQCDSIFSNNS